MNFVDLINFLRNFYGISNESLQFNKLSHKDIVYLFPFIEKVNIKNVSMEDIACGNIIGVYDKSNTIEYYVNPRIIVDTELETYNEESNSENNISIKNIENLSKKELLKLRRRLRKLGFLNEAYRTTKLIRKIKENEPKSYYERKEKLKIKERSNYD